MSLTSLYERREIRVSDLNTRVKFYEYVPKKGPLPGEVQERILYECWAFIERVRKRDLEQAKVNGTLEDLTITIRDPRSSYKPSNKHYVSINDDERYNIKSVQPNMPERTFITIIAELKE